MTSLFVALITLVLQGPPASVGGRVVQGGSGEPVDRARVLLTKVGGRLSDSLVVVADERGRFSIPNIPAGTYRLFAEHDDYVKAELGQRHPRQPGTAITLAPGETLRDVAISLNRTGVISGRIMDQSGEPARARVQALQRSYAEGKATWTVVAEIPTNDLGEYRLYGLAPGSYLVGATLYGYQRIQSGNYFALNPMVIDALISIADGPRSLVDLTRSGSYIEAAAVQGEVRSTKYFPSAGDAASAQVILVAPGSVVAGTDIHVLPVARARTSTLKVRGFVIDGSSGQRVADSSVQLGDPERPFYMETLSRRVISGANGDFEIDNIDPGRYAIVASASSGMSELMSLEVGGSDTDGIRVVLVPRININGRVSVQGDRATVDLTKMTLTLYGPTSSRQIVPKADGTFTILNVSPAHYRIALTSTSSNAFLKSARIGDADVLSSLPLTAPAAGTLELLISTNTASIEGSVAAGSRVVLVPDSARRTQFEHYRSTTSDRLGRFRIEGITPGEYTAFAWESLEENAWQIPEILRAYEGQGKPIRVGEGARETIALEIIPQSVDR